MSAVPVRERVVGAVIAIIGEAGFDGLSVRAVASRAEVSLGAVQHHFPTKAGMLHAAMTAISAAVRERYGTLDAVADPVERLHAVSEALVPADAASPVARVWLAFVARAAVDEQTRAEYADLWARLRANLRLLLVAAGASPQTAQEDSVELLALLDGLAVSVVAERSGIDPSTARRIARRRVDELIGPRG